MFSGYINNPEETRTSITDNGFFQTGDIVELRINLMSQLNVHVIDRKTSFFKLSQEQYVSHEYLQSIYFSNPVVKQISIHSDVFAHCVSSVVVPNRSYVRMFPLGNHMKDFDMSYPHLHLCDLEFEDFRAIGNTESL